MPDTADVGILVTDNFPDVKVKVPVGRVACWLEIEGVA
jgi:hypothetical protein